tara:strand:- start:29701 stop:30309 length:609 start_codon:yes stop_codon:yes gene_type:complete
MLSRIPVFKFYIIFLINIYIFGGYSYAGVKKSEYNVATFAGGCFWCLQPPYDKTEGVVKTVVGYAGGIEKNASYEQVSSGLTRHVEAIQITYDPSIVSYGALISLFWRNIDPFDNKGQFCDKGNQYKSVIYYHDNKQREVAEQTKQKIELDKQNVSTSLREYTTFYPAEDYHQSYYKKNPIRYKLYRYSCGRDKRLEAIWGR